MTSDKLPMVSGVLLSYTDSTKEELGQDDDDNDGDVNDVVAIPSKVDDVASSILSFVQVYK